METKSKRFMLDLYGEAKEVVVTERVVTIKEYWATAVDGSFQTETFPERLFDTPEEAEKSEK